MQLHNWEYPVMVYDINNPLYNQFKNIQIERWNKIGYKPILLVLCHEDKHIIHYPNYITKKVKYIENDYIWLQCHALRLYSYNLFINDNYKLLLTDIDMLPLAQWYYDNIFKNTTNNIMYINGGVPYRGYNKINICYTCATTKVGTTILQYSNMTLKDFYYHLINKFNYDWHSDELYLTEMVKCNKESVIVEKRDYGKIGRLDREEWKVCPTRLYVDMHCPRPYKENKNKIHEFLDLYDTKVNISKNSKWNKT